MALEGSLRDFDLFSLFNMIKTQGKSGTLVLSRGQEFVKIYFDQGEIVGTSGTLNDVTHRRQAVEAMRGFAKKHGATLGGLDLKSMVHEGHKY